MPVLNLVGGWHVGPLFIVVIERALKERMRGLHRIREIKKHVPAFANAVATRAVYRESRRMSALTGIQHSVDHVVPLHHPLVCGLHVDWNLEVKPLKDNVRKSNKHWPDMWGEQQEFSWT